MDDSLDAENKTAEDSANDSTEVGESLEPEPPKKRVIGRPFVKGQSGNPKGGPKSKETNLALRRLSAKRMPADLMKQIPPSLRPMLSKKPTGYELVAFRILAGAMSGDTQFIRIYLDRMEGKVQPDVATANTGQLHLIAGIMKAGPVPVGGVNPSAMDEEDDGATPEVAP
jgi:hypothetical protein